METIDFLNSRIDEENMDVQEMYFHMLDKIIDATILLQYKKSDSRVFASNAHISDRILTCFSEINNDNQKEFLQSMAKKFVIITDKPQNYPSYETLLEKLYQFYKKTGTLPKELTTPFFNELLNNQQDAYCRQTKKWITEKLNYTLPLSRKKKEQLIRTKKIEKMIAMFKKGKSSELNISEEEVERIIEEVTILLKKTKSFKKDHIHFKEEDYYQLGKLFFKGCLTKETIKEVCNIIVSEEVVKKLKNQYYKRMLPFLEKIKLSTKEKTDLEIKRPTVAYDYNHLVIASNKMYHHNLSYMKIMIGMNKLLEDSNQEFIKLLPLVSLVDDFKKTEMKDILLHSKEILESLKEEDPKFDGSITQILNQFSKVLQFAQIYAQTTPFVRKVLDEDIIMKILTHTNYFSHNPRDYFDIFQQMLRRKETQVPPISGTYQDYTYESGNTADKMRLLIGINTNNSCLGPNGAGEAAYEESLLKENADILLIKDEEENFVARSLIFRRGNYLIMSAFMGEFGIQRQFYKKEFLDKITNAFLEQSSIMNDDLEYIFLTCDPCDKIELKDYILVIERAIVAYLPHVDWSFSCYLIGGNEEEIRIHNKKMPASYQVTRAPICSNEEVTQQDLEQINILNASMTNQKGNFNMIGKKEEYKYLYKGQDWCLGVTDTGEETLIILPTEEERRYLEIEEARKRIEHQKSNDIVPVKIKK